MSADPVGDLIASYAREAERRRLREGSPTLACLDEVRRLKRRLLHAEVRLRLAHRALRDLRQVMGERWKGIS